MSVPGRVDLDGHHSGERSLDLDETLVMNQACIHELVEAQAARTPDAVAVVFGDRQLTFRELDERANRLANFLIGEGVGREAFVAVCLERSPEMIVALLGVLKSGGAYVPLDPTYPPGRLAQMTRETDAKLLLTQRKFGRAIAPGIPRVEVDAQWSEIERHCAEQPRARATPDNLAYAMYTSGSTGAPRGVLVPHRGVVNHNLAIADYFELREGDRVSQCTSLSFDISVEEIFPTLMRGATVVLHPPGVVGAGRDFTTWIREQRISVVDLPTAFWHEWVAYLERHGDALPPELRLAVVGGQKASAQVLQTWKKRTGSGVRWINGYGPTEASIAVIFYSPDDPNEPALGPDEQIPIGRAIPGTAAYILDPSGVPCEEGETGELYLGGACVARGYLDHPALTAEKFVPDPFAGSPGARMYRTGDLARRKADGRIEFAGRVDDQVKVRGFRVELGEVEAALREHPDVHDAAVVARDAGDHDKRLAAFAVLKRPGTRVADLSRFLKGRLPAYMVPADIVILDALPLTPTGKTDKAALPVPRATRETAGVEFVAPAGEVEITLAQIWSAVLGIDDIGTADDFFDLGGHSLRATQVASRIRDAFGVEIPLSEVFAQRTIADLARVVDAHRAAPAREVVRIPKEPRDRAIPLSFSQERVWFLQQLDPTSLAYNFQTFLEFTGPLDVPALRRALDTLVARHEIFRTTFVDAGGGVPTQQIHPPFAVDLPVIDLRTVPTGRRGQELDDRANAALSQPFDMSRLPLIRWVLFQTADDEFSMLHVEHHLIHDGWSFNVFRRELLQLYNVYSRGETPALEPPAVQFADYAAWQRQWMSGSVLDAQLDFWKKQLADAPPLELPTDRARPATQSFRGAVHEIELSAERYAALRALSDALGTTLFVTLEAAFAVLLHRYTGQDDISIGTGVANRRWTETEGLIGMLVNNVVLRSVVRDDLTFKRFMSEVKRTTLNAYANQDAPFDHVVRAVGAPADPSRNPLFQVMFSFHDSPLDEPSIPGVDFHCVEIVSNRSAKFDLNVVAVPHAEQRAARDRSGGPSGITVIWEYNTALFDRETVEQMARHYGVLLDSIIANPDVSIFELALLETEERAAILAAGDRTSVPFPSDRTIHQVFEDVVARTPDAAAIVASDVTFTYRELDARANALAHRLRDHGIDRGDTVGVFLDRSAEMVIGLLGILKAGAAYVPMDVGFPDERLHFIAEETRVSLVLASDATRARAEQLLRNVVVVDPRHPDAASRAAFADARNGMTGALDLAYVMFTSGSTGKPKGVAVPHRAVMRLVFGADYVDLGPERRILHMAPLSFDSSTFEIWGSLLHGATLVVHVGHVPTPAQLGDILRANAIDTLWLTASMFNSVIDEAPDSLSGVQQLLVGGEALSVSHVRRAREKLSNTRLINGYGPTESTTFTCCHPITEQVDATTRSIPIGRPIGNTRVYLLDRQLNPVPIGVAGELHIGGDGLARGYFGRAELTADRFIPDPFGPSASRLYRTGDFARYRRDGLIEFVGRADDQVKIRGYRIELGEIENALRSQPSIRDAAVVARDDVPGGRALVAYLVPSSEMIDVEVVRQTLRRSLPVYMIPSRFVVMDALPLSPTGKVSRRHLPAPTPVAGDSHRAFVEPRNDVERAVAGIWRDVLGVERLSTDDNFFDLGGHSLLATRIVARIREELLIDLSLRTLFEFPTVAGLAKRISEEASSRFREQHGRSARRYVFPLKPVSGGKPIFFLPGGHGGDYEFLVYARLVHHVGDGFSFYGIRARSADGVETAHRSVEEMAADYIAEIRAVQPSGPYRLVGNCIGGVVAYEVARQLHRAGEEVRSLVLMDTDFPTTKRYMREIWSRVDNRWNLSYYSGRVSHHLRALRTLPPKTWGRYLFGKATAVVKDTPMLGYALDPRTSVKVGYVDTLRRYRPRRYGGSLSIIASQHDDSDPTEGWSKVVRGEIRVRSVPGDHKSYIRDFVKEAAMRLRDCLEE